MQVCELASIYSKDVVFIDPIAQHNGLGAVEEYFTKLLKNAKHCEFTIHQQETAESGDCVVTWTMEFSSKNAAKVSQSKLMSVDGITLLKIRDDKIFYHRDYYDLGQMVYENIPILGWLIKKIKRSIA